MADIDMGVYTYERETKNTRRYTHENETGQKETMYVPKSKLNGETPEKIQVIVRPA